MMPRGGKQRTAVAGYYCNGLLVVIASVKLCSGSLGLIRTLQLAIIVGLPLFHSLARV